MAAVGNLPNQLSTLQLEGSEGKTAPLGAVKISAFKTHAYICTGKRLNGEVHLEYAIGEIKFFEEVASLKFNTSEKPPSEMSGFLNEKGVPTIEDFSSDTQVICRFERPHWEGISQRNPITTIIVNVFYSYHPQRSWILSGISDLCKSAFINMKPECSTVNVHFGYRHWTVDSVLLPENDVNIYFREK